MSVRHWVRSGVKGGAYLWNGLLDLAYPPVCLVCEAPGPLLCERCVASFMPVDEPGCVVCGRPVMVGFSCKLCGEMDGLGGWAFAGVRSCGQFIGPLAHAVRRLKYSKLEMLGEPLGQWLTLRCVEDGLLPTKWQAELANGLVVPVPLHPSRLRERGFNQAEQLAFPLADRLRLEVSTALTLRRVRRTDSQVGQSTQARRANITEDVFDIGDTQTVQERPVLLVDDVFTTGTTLNACARALAKNGAGPIYAVTLAAGI